MTVKNIMKNEKMNKAVAFGKDMGKALCYFSWIFPGFEACHFLFQQILCQALAIH